MRPRTHFDTVTQLRVKFKSACDIVTLIHFLVIIRLVNEEKVCVCVCVCVCVIIKKHIDHTICGDYIIE